MGQALGASVSQPDLGARLLRKGLVHEAIPFLERSHVEEPQEWEHLSNLGVAHRLQGEFAEAKNCLQQALRLSPDSPQIWLNFGVLLNELGDFSDALEAFRVAYEWMPENQIAAFNYADSLLRFGRWKEGWPLWEIGRFNRTQKLPEGIARWAGEPLDGKRIIVVPEGGRGDVFLYMRWLKDLRQMGAHISVMPFSGQEDILRGHLWIDEVVTDWNGKYDFAVSIMSLPALLNADLGIPGEIGYLRSHGNLIGTALPLSKRSGRPWVGICWKAKEVGSSRRVRSLSDRDISPLADAPVTWVSLQPDCAKSWMLDLNVFNKNWKSTAILIEKLDFVVTCDTAVANLAGAIGKPVWVMLPRNCEWKWGISTETSAIYPTARLFRATSTLWTDVVERVVKELSR